MSTYLIGDLQGCFDSLQALLTTIQFNPQQDQLGFAGDLVNRGPKSLEVLRFINGLSNPIVVLGNHDLHLLALYFHRDKVKGNGTLTQILESNECDHLIDWLIHQPLLTIGEQSAYALVHAGIPPQWTIENAKEHAKTVECALQKNPELFLKNMYGNFPNEWHDDLEGWDRLRYIVNAFTRMRFCNAKGTLDLDNKTDVSTNPNLKPWFNWRTPSDTTIYFGHWASLEGKCDAKNIIALDAGCLWGGQLKAVRLADKKVFTVSNTENAM